MEGLKHLNANGDTLDSKCTQVFSKYNLNLNDDDVQAAVKKLLDNHLKENDTRDAKLFCLNSVELTTLKTTDSEDSVLKLIERINAFDEDYAELGHVATICVYPCYAKICHDTLENEDIDIACVAGGFPSGQTFQEVKVAETALAIQDGATEIDTVMPVGKFLVEDYDGVADDIEELKSVCGDKKLKVILETGALKTAANIKKASLLCMYAGADFIKTSTGKLSPAATPEAAYVMCQAIKEYYDKTGIQVGFKAAGGMRTVEDVLTYYTIAKEVLGEKWLTNEWFRLGTSSCADKLLCDITDKDEPYFG